MEFEQAVWRGHQVLKAGGGIVQGDAIGRLRRKSPLSLKPLPHGLPGDSVWTAAEAVSREALDALARTIKVQKDPYCNSARRKVRIRMCISTLHRRRKSDR